MLTVTSPGAFASGTAAWEMNSYNDFIRGRFAGISLSREGRLSLAPKLDTIFSSDQPVIWSVAEAPDGSLYAATGNRGRVYRIDPAGKSSLLWTAEQPEVFAIAVDQAGIVYAGTSPDGKVYRIEGGKATEYFDPHARYIWSLAVGPDGVLYVGTGDQGKVYRVEGPGKGDVYYETGPIPHHRPRRGLRTAACWPAPNPTASSTAFPPKTKPSCCMTPTCRKSAPSCPCPMAPSTQPPSEAPSPNRRKPPLRPRRTLRPEPRRRHHHHYGGSAEQHPRR